MPISLAFRGSQWWLVGTTDTRAGSEELALVVVLAAGAVFVVVLALELLGGVHRDRTTVGL